MRFILAFKAFFKAFSKPEEAKLFVEGTPAPSKQLVDQHDYSHLRLLTLLQQSGRLIDFLKEDISSFSDAQVGAAVRKIHQDCSSVLEDCVTIRPVMDQDEETPITVPSGYDPTQIKIVGKVQGGPPFKGILVHKGWKAHKRSLPKQIQTQVNEILSPAEVEIR